MGSTPMLLKQSIFLLAATSLIAAPTIPGNSIVANGKDKITVRLDSCNRPVRVTIGSAPATSGVGFTITRPTSNWFGYSADSMQTEARVTFSIANTSGLTPGASADFIFAPATGDGDSATVTVTFDGYASCTVDGAGSLTVTPNPLNLQVVSGSTTSTLTLTNNGSSTVNYTARINAEAQSWLAFWQTGGTLATQTSGTVAANSAPTLTVIASAANLNFGDHPATITFTPEDGADIVVTVNFHVGTGAAGSGTLTFPAYGSSTLNLSLPYTMGSAPPQATQYGLQSGSGAQQFQVTSINTEDGGAWLGAGGAMVTTNPSGPFPISRGIWVGLVHGGVSILSPGYYRGAVTLTADDGSTAVINVYLTVNGTAPGITVVGGTSYRFVVPSGSNMPTQPTAFTISADTEHTLGTPEASTLNGGDWLSITKQGGSSSWSIFATANPAGLADGTYTGAITVRSSGPGGATATTSIQITLVVGLGGAMPLTIGSLDVFSAPVNGTTQTQYLSVSSSIAIDFAVGYSSAGNWLTVTPTGNMKTNQSLAVSVNPTGMAEGSHYGTITLTAGGVTETLTVTLRIGPIGTGDITVTAQGQSGTPSLTFSSGTGGQSPAAQSLNIAAEIQGAAPIPLSVATSTESGGAWLTTAFQAGSATPYTLTVTVTPGTLAPGTYKGKVTITPTGGTAVEVPVTFTVTAGASVSASPASLTFNYQAGGEDPSPGSIQVSGTGSNPAFTASAATLSGGAWLSVTPTSGTAPQTLSVRVMPGSLDAGTYNGFITVAGANGAAGGGTVNVTLTVTVPLPTIEKIVNAATGLAGAIAPGEIVSLYAPAGGAHPIGPATPVETKLDETGKVATKLGGVQVLFNGYAAPLTYVGAGQINAVVPYEVSGVSSPWVQVKFLDRVSNTIALARASASPGVFTVSGTGSGAASVANQNGSLNGPASPAAIGDLVTFYMTGEGETLPGGVTGKVTTVSSSKPLTPQPVLAVGVTIDGQPVDVPFYGEAPYMVSGVMMVQAVIPPGARPGDRDLVVSVGGVASPSNVTVSIR
jgi:trimeric autotransporter adhesin